MLKIKTKVGFLPLINIQNFNILHEYEGDLSLSFDLPTRDKSYLFIHEESLLKFEDNDYEIKTINQRKAITTVTATLDMSEWKKNMHQTFHSEQKTLSELLSLIKPAGWTFTDSGIATMRRAITLEGATDYDVLMTCKKTYGVVFEYHVSEKRIKVIKPDVIQPRGLYMSDELNLQDVEYKGSTNDFATRIYPFGKKTEEKDEEGNIISTTYVTITTVNGGKSYIDINTYSDKVVSVYWQDDRYLDPQELFDDAYEKLSVLAKPVKSYACKLIDLSRTNDKYKMLDFKMYDKTTLIDSSGIRAEHQIVQYKRYPNNERSNEVTLSTEFKKITGTIDGIKNSVGQLDTSLKINENATNEIRRDVKSNTLLITNTYRKAETDKKITSAIQQSEENINLSVTEVNKKVDTIQKDLSGVKEEILTIVTLESVNGVIYKNTEIATVLLANVYHGKKVISEIKTLKSVFGDNAKILWRVKKIGELVFTPIPQNDPRIGNDSFSFVSNAKDFNSQVIFGCDLDY